LSRATEIFWRNGYEGASLADLTAAMDINAPSLYAAFGNKEGLFRAVVERYGMDRSRFLANVLAAPTARAAVELFLRGVVEKSTDSKTHPPGCILLQGGLSCGDSGIPAELARQRAATETALRERFQRARHENDLPEDTDAAALARYVTAVCNGLCIQASAGATADELHKVVDVALASWPENTAAKTKKKSPAKPRPRALLEARGTAARRK
jgi:AcrR family transcriptional regulator